MNFRTDLALECNEALGAEPIKGIRHSTKTKEGRKITRIDVMDSEGEKAIGKPCGTYITVEVPFFGKRAELDGDTAEDVADSIRSLLPKTGTILVAGLGNEEITPDALGPKAANLILATRHIEGELAKAAGLGELRPVVSLIPGVLGKTGIETGETLRGIVEMVRPAAVITMDALAARKMSRLGSTVQIANTGVTPGSGVGNARVELSEKSLGVPVIAIGVPTVVDASTVVADFTGKPLEADTEMMVTPREIDLVIDRAAKLLALAVNRALQPHLTPEDILTLVS